MALAGDNVVVKMDNASGTLTTFDAGDITSVDLGLTFTQHDVTGMGDAAQHFINGQLQAPVTLKGFVTTTASTGTHTVISSVFQQEKQVTLEVQVTPSGPTYSGEFFVESYKPALSNGGAVTFEAMLKPAIGTAPAWS